MIIIFYIYDKISPIKKETENKHRKQTWPTKNEVRVNRPTLIILIPDIILSIFVFTILLSYKKPQAHPSAVMAIFICSRHKEGLI